MKHTAHTTPDFDLRSVGSLDMLLRTVLRWVAMVIAIGVIAGLALGCSGSSDGETPASSLGTEAAGPSE